MAKLYWRVKKNGKWTWKPATIYDRGPSTLNLTDVEIVHILEEEE